jgi:hypothetical protein
MSSSVTPSAESDRKSSDGEMVEPTTIIHFRAAIADMQYSQSLVKLFVSFSFILLLFYSLYATTSDAAQQQSATVYSDLLAGIDELSLRSSATVGDAIENMGLKVLDRDGSVRARHMAGGAVKELPSFESSEYFKFVNRTDGGGTSDAYVY